MISYRMTLTKHDKILKINQNSGCCRLSILSHLQLNVVVTPFESSKAFAVFASVKKLEMRHVFTIVFVLDRVFVGGNGDKNIPWNVMRQPEIRLTNQLRLVVYPMIYKVFLYPGWWLTGFLNHQQYVWCCTQVGFSPSSNGMLGCDQISPPSPRMPGRHFIFNYHVILIGGAIRVARDSTYFPTKWGASRAEHHCYSNTGTRNLFIDLLR